MAGCIIFIQTHVVCCESQENMERPPMNFLQLEINATWIQSIFSAYGAKVFLATGKCFDLHCCGCLNKINEMLIYLTDGLYS